MTLTAPAQTTPLRTPQGSITIVDPSPLNWLFITWNTVEEPVRTDRDGRIVPAVLTDFRWLDGGTTLEIDVREDVVFQDGEPLAATWLQPREERTDRVVLKANTSH